MGQTNHALTQKTSLGVYYSLLELDNIGGKQLFFSCNDEQIFLLFQVSRGQDRKRWHKERVAPVFAVQGGRTSNYRGIAMGDISARWQEETS